MNTRWLLVHRINKKALCPPHSGESMDGAEEGHTINLQPKGCAILDTRLAPLYLINNREENHCLGALMFS